jgi:uncharacterized heparinase superfamily protein
MAVVEATRAQLRAGDVPEVLRAALHTIMAPLLALWRRTWVYRTLLLKGKMPDRIVFHPHDASPRRLADAEALLHGRFRFAGETVDIGEGSIFDKPPPSRAWAEALHGFAWLPPLSAAGGEPARVLATNLISQWVKRYGRYSEPAWLPEITAQRLINIFSHGRFVLSNSDVMWRSRLFVSLREQSRLLARTSHIAADGLPRFEAAVAHALSGICLDDGPQRLVSGLACLEREIGRQILPDGGHVSRSPESLLQAYNRVVMAMDGLTAVAQPAPAGLRSARDRMAPMMRFFRLGDGALAVFNGGRECEPRTIESLLARDEVRGQPFAFAPHSGFQRMAAGKSLLVLDCGKPPEGSFSTNAHAGCLSFEFCAGPQRIVVNCGTPGALKTKWGNALRATAAHSTVTLADTSMAAVLSGLGASLLGPRLVNGPRAISTNRHESSLGWTVDAAHDGYLDLFGIVHERKITLSHQGGRLAGEDRLIRKARPKNGIGTAPFTARFHIHPDVRLSPNQAGGILLKLPNGEGWRFQASGGEIAIEESIYYGGEIARKTEQLVVSGIVRNEPVEIGWVFEQIGM